VKLYVAGPMAGLPELNFPAFRDATAKLEAAGFTVVDPSCVDHGPNPEWAACLRGDIPLMLACDGVATLPNWWRSRGARLEVHIAAALDMPVLPVAEWLTNANAYEAVTL
jgi:hypothetical protein